VRAIFAHAGAVSSAALIAAGVMTIVPNPPTPVSRT
jgi:hypothetical protein